jgi:general secretion pathway protein L
MEPEGLCLYGPRQGSRESAALAEAAGLPTFTPARLHLEGWPADADPEAAVPALGAALRGVGRVPLPANLLPPESRDRAHSGSLLMNKFFLMALAGLLCLWVGSLLIHKRVALYQVNRELASLSGEARQLEQRLREGKTLTDQLAAFRQKMGQYPDKLRALRELTRLIPEHTYIFHLRISQQQLEMSGMSKSAADLIPLLERSGWLTKAEFASPIVTDASKLEHFKIKAEIKVVEPAS